MLCRHVCQVHVTTKELQKGSSLVFCLYLAQIFLFLELQAWA